VREQGSSAIVSISSQASDEARFITGTVLFVDGGMSSRIG
jgi:NAD(P)-dependent dehydrogenase (short-subunit alcohol dehydrogenase family)